MHATVISRASGGSAVAAAAYRSGEKLIDERTGEAHDYSRRDGVDGAEIIAPEGAPDWVRERARLWNSGEAAEKRKDSQVAREVRVALPRELDPEQRRELVRGFVQAEFAGRGMVADVSYHDGNSGNPHAHILLTTRELNSDGFGGKDRSWNSKELLSGWREQWAESANRVLDRAGRAERIDHRTLAAQRTEAIGRGQGARAEKLDRDPEIHLGKAAWMARLRGEGNERTRRNDRICSGNQAREMERSRLARLLRALDAEIRAVRLQEAVARASEKVKAGAQWIREIPQRRRQAAAERRVQAAAAMLTAVEAGGDVRGRDDETGATPLHCAAELGREEMIVRLVKAGADVDARDWEGATPLYRAVEKGWAESAGTLLKHGADPNFPDHEGRTPWGMAADAGREDIMGQFRDQEAKRDGEREARLQRTRQWLREPEAPRREEADWRETARIHGEAWERQRRAAFIRSIDHRVPVEERLDARRETEGWERRHPQEAAELKSAAKAAERAERKPLPELTPALRKAGWDEMAQIREEVSFTKGRIIVRGKLVSRGRGKRADYILYYKPNIPVALIEAKDNTHAIGDGMQQGLDYAETLHVPFVFSSNGDGFVFHDRTGAAAERETTLGLDAFPPPGELWGRYRAWKGLTPESESIILQDYFDDSGDKAPRYYQVNAINATIEAMAKGLDRILLVMATGTGKTYTAFQIIWRLWKAGRKKRILFLADRNVLIDQTMVNDFRPFKAAMTKLSTQAGTIERADDPSGDRTRAIEGKRRIDTAYEVYLGLYQAITGPEDHQKIFRELSPSFFDLIVIDECHRGSAAEDSAWREILEYFSSATQIGLTATPKETKYVSNIHYFGEPVYSYSLKQGIQDGFLAPYKVIKVHIDRDVEGYRPEKGQMDRDGMEVEDRIYNTRDFDRTLVLDDRTQLVAGKITEFLKESGDRFQKAIVFCVDQEHAARMRQALINENADLVETNHRYVMRITGADTEGQGQLGNFIDPESRYPVMVTTSRLLSTGVDVQTCRLIVLDREVGSMTEFKQIVGRGTRVHEDTRKFYFTLMDFRGATNHFADPDFDGEPVQIYEPGEDDPITPPDDIPPTDEDPIPPAPGEDETIVDVPTDITLPPDGQGQRKVYVDGVGATIVAERVEYLDENGKLVTESLRDFTKRALRKRFSSLDAFLRRWKGTQRKQAIIEELKAEGLDLGVISEELGKDLDPFDLICHVAFDAKPLTRRERAENVKKRDVFSKYGDPARAVLDALLAKYADEGVLNLEDTNVLRITPFSELGTPVQLIQAFGGHAGFVAAAHDLQSALYREIV